MESLPRNGSYFERRKMYIEFPLHNMKSKVPIDWDSDQPHTYERHRPIAREHHEKQYIKRTYQQKLERKLKEIYRGGAVGDLINNGREASFDNKQEALTKQIEEFNTSKVIPPPSNPNNNPEHTQSPSEPYTPSLSSKQGDRYNKDVEGGASERERRYSEQQRRYEQERGRQQGQGESSRSRNYEADRQGHSYDNRMQMNRSYNQLQRSQRESPHLNQYPPSPIYRGESDMGPKSNRPYHILPSYRPPYPQQQQYSYDYSAARHPRAQFHPELPPGHPNPHPFRNHLPDRLEEFLREKTKADRKNTLTINLKDR